MSPLRTAAPCGRPAHRLGDCAGRSPGLRVITSRPAFPVSQWPMRTKGSPLTVAGAATVTAQRVEQDNYVEQDDIEPTRVPSCLPGATRGTSTGPAFRDRTKGSRLGHANNTGQARKSAACCSVATEYDRRPWHSVPAYGLWGHRTPAAVTQTGYAYCQLRDTQLSVQSRRGHGPLGNGAREFHGHPCLGGLRRTRAPPLPVAFDCPLARAVPRRADPLDKKSIVPPRRYAESINAC
jgi:hypothetical protein